jgi:hypothetical protein
MQDIVDTDEAEGTRRKWQLESGGLWQNGKMATWEPDILESRGHPMEMKNC